MYYLMKDDEKVMELTGNMSILNEALLPLNLKNANKEPNEEYLLGLSEFNIELSQLILDMYHIYDNQTKLEYDDMIALIAEKNIMYNDYYILKAGN